MHVNHDAATMTETRQNRNSRTVTKLTRNTDKTSAPKHLGETTWRMNILTAKLGSKFNYDIMRWITLCEFSTFQPSQKNVFTHLETKIRAKGFFP